MRVFIPIAAAVSLCAASQAQAAAPPVCLEAQEIEGLVGYFLPRLAKQVETECSAALPATSYLRAGFPGWLAAADAAHEAYWPQARAGFIKLAASGGDKFDPAMMAAMSRNDDALKGVIAIAIDAKLKLHPKPAECGEINDIVEAFSPLTPPQSVTLVSRIVSAALRKDKNTPTCART